MLAAHYKRADFTASKEAIRAMPTWIAAGPKSIHKGMPFHTFRQKAKLVSEIVVFYLVDYLPLM